MWKCPKECSTCNTSYCGTPDQEPDQCPCAKSEMPPRSEIKNVDGKPIPEHLYRKLVWTYGMLQKNKGTPSLITTDVWGDLRVWPSLNGK